MTERIEYEEQPPLSWEDDDWPLFWEEDDWPDDEPLTKQEERLQEMRIDWINHGSC